MENITIKNIKKISIYTLTFIIVSIMCINSVNIIFISNISHIICLFTEFCAQLIDYLVKKIDITEEEVELLYNQYNQKLKYIFKKVRVFYVFFIFFILIIIMVIMNINNKIISKSVSKILNMFFSLTEFLYDKTVILNEIYLSLGE